jgi:hypothetical protein
LWFRWLVFWWVLRVCLGVMVGFWSLWVFLVCFLASGVCVGIVGCFMIRDVVAPLLAPVRVALDAKRGSLEYLVGRAFFLGLFAGFCAGVMAAYYVFVWV